MTAPMVDYKIHWLKMMSVPESRAVVGRHDGINGRDKRINTTTWEFKLRKGIKFHNGSDFDADDVVYTLNWAADPKIRMRAKSRFNWIKRAEKVDSHTVRIVSKRPFATALGQLMVASHIFPSDLHGSLIDCGGGPRRGARGGKGKGKRGGKFGKRGKRKAAAKASPKIRQARRAGKCKEDYGRNTPIGTGAYKVVATDRSSISLEAVKNYPHANSAYPVPAIKRVRIQVIPDSQTQVAQMLTGGIDMTRLVEKGIGEQLAKDPRFAVTIVNGLRYNWMNFDTADRSRIGVLKDVRVRRAIAHAINRDELRKSVVVGGEKTFDPKALCAPVQVNCATTVDLPEYDPAKAKKLLAEAGHPNGFPLKINTIIPNRAIATAVAGYLRKVGIKATVQALPFASHRRANRQGKVSVALMTYGGSGIADAGKNVAFHFQETRDYSGDPAMRKFALNNDTILDQAGRAKAIQDAFDRNNRQSFALPLTGAPTVFAHSKDLVLPTISINGYGAVINQMKWK